MLWPKTSDELAEVTAADLGVVHAGIKPPLRELANTRIDKWCCNHVYYRDKLYFVYLRAYLKTLKPAAKKQDFARRCKRSLGYLYLVAGQHRSASAQLALAIERVTRGAVNRRELRPDLYPPERQVSQKRH